MTDGAPWEAFSRRVFLALVHYPVYNKEGNTIASALTTIDIHDFSRIARTYGLGGAWIVTPLASQKVLFARMMDHWTKGYGAVYNPNRKEALRVLSLSDTVEEMREKIHQQTGNAVHLIATSARAFPGSVSIPRLSGMIRQSQDCYVLLFGTGWGLHDSLIEKCGWTLTPLRSCGYNHLSVRSAAAIICDRLIGEE